MAGFRKPEIPRDQLVMWSHKLDDALPADHPVRQLLFLLESESFAATFGDWAAEYVLLEGKPPYHPRDLAVLYLYGMLNKLRSSRQLEMATYNRVDVIWLMSGQTPDHSTIAEFVKVHGPRLRHLFRDTVRVAIRAGLVKLEHVAVDGTKIEADASKRSVHREESISAELAKLDQQIDALEKEWAENEKREASLFGEQTPWISKGSSSVPEQLARQKEQQRRLKKALENIQRRRDESVNGPEPKPIASVTDPDSRVMPDKEGKSKPNYNAQIAVDAAAGVVVATDVNDRAEDSGQMTPVLKQVAEECGTLPQEVSADSQYNTGPELAELERMGVTGFLPDAQTPSEVPSQETPAAQALLAAQSGATLTEEQWAALPKDSKGRIEKEAFRYDAKEDVYRCPMGQTLPFLRFSTAQRYWGQCSRVQYGGCPACATCPKSGMCCGNPTAGRTITRDQYEDHRERMRARLTSETGRTRYRLRGQTVEPRFGYIKRGLGVRRFLHRGLTAVRTEWSLVCTAVNLGILLRHWAEVQKIL